MVDDDRSGYAKRDIQKLAFWTGIVFLIVGIAGFVPALTPGSLAFAGAASTAKLIGLFQVSVLHNLLHLLYGVVGIIAAASRGFSRYYLIWGGVLYLLLWIFGLIVEGTTINLVPLNDPDNWLHFALGIIMSGLGLFAGRFAADVSGRPRTASR